MRNPRIALTAALLLAAPLFTSGCITTPSIKDRVVDLVASNTAIIPLHASGSTNLDANSGSVDLGSEVDIAQTLDDAGIDISDVKSITLSAVSYRITTPDPQPTRTINGSISIAIGAQSSQPLVTNFSGNAGAVTGWITPTLGSAAVTQVNTLLGQWLGELQGGAPPASKVLSYSEAGTSTPAAATNFDYELRLTLSIVGKVKVKILS